MSSDLFLFLGESSFTASNKTISVTGSKISFQIIFVRGVSFVFLLGSKSSLLQGSEFFSHQVQTCFHHRGQTGNVADEQFISIFFCRGQTRDDVFLG